LKLQLIITLALVAVATAQYLAVGGYEHGSAPSIHSPFASSTSTGIRRYGSTAGYYGGVPAAVGYAGYAGVGYAGYAGHGGFYGALVVVHGAYYL